MPSSLLPDTRLELLVAVAENEVIGRANGLPWRLPDDLKRFKRMTLGKPVLMGRKTYESIGKALPERQNLVMSRTASPRVSDSASPPELSAAFAPPDAQVIANLPAALEAAAHASVLMVIGGGEIYAQTLPHAHRIHLTLVHTRVPDGDAFFRGWQGPQFRQVDIEYHAADARHAHPFSFITLERT